ncbi:TIGR04219 family outer membrane beta-barrel protein [Aliarcobacter thereius]|uniref:TIGR04219 family outer membrane beta-barrel protein n=1 Tax=Aliarcobacter thereius TaxID=544718 RepID=UPI000826F3DE|nr:TIGR04219 family outer membrane beta-barrel protein [Aliarcobacter thereius]OCL92149.1 hypothetical protein AAX25_00879 [Aliarcobacter thereius]
MNKNIKVAIIASSLLLSSANADFLRAELGAGSWLSKPSGEIKEKSGNGIDSSKEDSQANFYAWAYFKHFLPLIPNLKVEYSNVENEGRATGNFSSYGTSGQSSDFTMKQIDIIPYYNILDNTFWTTIDLGVDFKLIDTDYEVSGIQNSKISKSFVLPMGYARARVEIPATPFGIEADIKYVKYSDNQAYDSKIKIDYTFDFPVIQPALEFGYRVQKIKVDKLSNLETDLDFSGVYAGLMFRF